MPVCMEEFFFFSSLIKSLLLVVGAVSGATLTCSVIFSRPLPLGDAVTVAIDWVSNQEVFSWCLPCVGIVCQAMALFPQ